MSWLFKSSQSDDPDSSCSHSHLSSSPEHSPSTSPPALTHDLSLLGQTLATRFRGVAEFLAPSPPATPITPTSSVDSSDAPSPSQSLLGIRNDLVEISGSFRTGLSLLSGNKAVSEISRLASNFFLFQNDGVRDEQASGEDDDDRIDDGVPGVTDEVVDFVCEISARPELWNDFPLPLDNDFNMSDAQREHASTVERLAPSLAALRVKLQSYMSEERFWIIYFILLLPRLSEHDFELLSTSKIVESRDALLKKQQKNAQVENDNRKTLDKSQDGCTASEPEGKNVLSEEEASTGIISAGVEMDDEQNTEKWLEDEPIDTGTTLRAQKKLEHEEDLSFSDLEEDDNDLSNRLSGLNFAEETKVSSPRGCNDWVQLKGSPGSLVGGGQQKAVHSNSHDKDSEGEESNDWLTVDDFD